MAIRRHSFMLLALRPAALRIADLTAENAAREGRNRKK
jgi:hypothetical protein